MWLRHSHSLHHQSAFVVFICLPSDTDSIPHPSASAAPLSKCLADWVGGGRGIPSHRKSTSPIYSYICRDKKQKKISIFQCYTVTFPPKKIPDWVPGLASGACGVHSFAAYPHIHPFSHPLCRSSSLSATAVEARLAHE